MCVCVCVYVYIYIYCFSSNNLHPASGVFITNNYIPRSNGYHFLSLIDCKRIISRNRCSFVSASYDNNVVQYRVFFFLFSAIYSIAMYNSTLQLTLISFSLFALLALAHLIHLLIFSLSLSLSLIHSLTLTLSRFEY